MISAERLKTLRSYFANKGIVQNTPRPTIAELEKLLSQDDSTLKVEILPSGEVRATSGAEWTDAVSVIDECLAARQRLAEMRVRVDNLYNTVDSKQAKIDALMMEFCPGEMSAEQKDEWARNQVADDPLAPTSQPSRAKLACRLFGHTSTDHGPFHGAWPDDPCRRCGGHQRVTVQRGSGPSAEFSDEDCPGCADCAQPERQGADK